MRYVIITPAFNESATIADYIRSVIGQSVRPARLVIVNDHSTDSTANIAHDLAQDHEWITVLDRQSEPVYQTGSKIAGAFLFGLEQTGLDGIDVIAKTDADLVLPGNYFEKVLDHFKRHSDTGICGGLCALRSGRELRPEPATDLYHVRGALKAYRRPCYEQIGGIRAVYGWDTLDELLASYYGWNTVVLPDLLVEHRSPTGTKTNASRLHKMTGALFYKLGYDPLIAFIASAKRFRMPPGILPVMWSYYGYIKAALKKKKRYVNQSQGHYIRRLRYRRMKEKIFGKFKN